MAEDVYDCDNEPEIPADHVLCPRCNGCGEVPCHCGGDLCLCGEEERPCPLCGGEYGGGGYVSKAKADAYWNRRHQFHDAIRSVANGSGDA